MCSKHERGLRNWQLREDKHFWWQLNLSMDPANVSETPTLWTHTADWAKTGGDWEGVERWKGGENKDWRWVGVRTILLSLLDACVGAGDVEEFQGPGSSGWWSVECWWGADGALTPNTRLWDRRYDGVAVQEPELQEEKPRHLTLWNMGNTWVRARADNELLLALGLLGKLVLSLWYFRDIFSFYENSF